MAMHLQRKFFKVYKIISGRRIIIPFYSSHGYKIKDSSIY
jgi:hypothetical protein